MKWRPILSGSGLAVDTVDRRTFLACSVLDTAWMGAVRRAGGLPTQLGLAPDRLDAVQALFAKGLDAEVLITSAGPASNVSATRAGRSPG